MKHYLYLITILLAATTLQSCLDEKPRDQISEEELYSSADGFIQNTVVTLYYYIGGDSDSQGLQGTARGVYDYSEFTTDEAIIPIRSADWYDGGFWEDLYLHTWTASDAALLNTWNYLYKIIVLCNRSLQRLQLNAHLLSPDQLQAYQAEVRGLRAMYYFYLLDLFGNVPLVTSAETSIDDVAQSNRREVFDFVFSELQAVEGQLAESHSNQKGDYYGRITRPVAHFLLAKLALNAEIFTDNDWTDNQRIDGKDIFFTVDGTRMNAWKTTQAYCKKIADCGYALENQYERNFQVHNSNSIENIFTIPMDKTLYTNRFIYLFRSRHYSHGGAYGLGSENGPSATTTAVRTYGYGTDQEDNRLRINFFCDTVKVNNQLVFTDSGDPLVYRPLAITKFDISGFEYEKTAGARMHKYEIDETAYDDGKLQDNDIVLYRYADVLLMCAEAIVRDGEGDAFTPFNRVRSRANMPPREPTLKNIIDERLMELCWEGWRRQDMIRFDLFHRSYDLRTPVYGEENRFTTVFPIPQKTLSMNKKLKQNPGY